MDKANDHTLRKIIFASEVLNHRNFRNHYYTCPECGQQVFFRQSTEIKPHFYHKKYNPDCSLSVEPTDLEDNSFKGYIKRFGYGPAIKIAINSYLHELTSQFTMNPENVLDMKENQVDFQLYKQIGFIYATESNYHKRVKFLHKNGIIPIPIFHKNTKNHENIYPDPPFGKFYPKTNNLWLTKQEKQCFVDFDAILYIHFPIFDLNNVKFEKYSLLLDSKNKGYKVLTTKDIRSKKDLTKIISNMVKNYFKITDNFYNLPQKYNYLKYWNEINPNAFKDMLNNIEEILGIQSRLKIIDPPLFKPHLLYQIDNDLDTSIKRTEILYETIGIFCQESLTMFRGFIESMEKMLFQHKIFPIWIFHKKSKSKSEHRITVLGNYGRYKGKFSNVKQKYPEIISLSNFNNKELEEQNPNIYSLSSIEKFQIHKYGGILYYTIKKDKPLLYFQEMKPLLKEESLFYSVSLNYIKDRSQLTNIFSNYIFLDKKTDFMHNNSSQDSKENHLDDNISEAQLSIQEYLNLEHKIRSNSFIIEEFLDKRPTKKMKLMIFHLKKRGCKFSVDEIDYNDHILMKGLISTKFNNELDIESQIDFVYNFVGPVLCDLISWEDMRDLMKEAGGKMVSSAAVDKMRVYLEETLRKVTRKAISMAKSTEISQKYIELAFKYL